MKTILKFIKSFMCLYLLLASEIIYTQNIYSHMSENGVQAHRNPYMVKTCVGMKSDSTFLPHEDSDTTPSYISIEGENILDTTDMHPSTKWYTESFKSDLSDFNISSYVLNTIEVVKDTILDNRYCYVLGVTSDRVYYAESELIVYTKNGKFFFHEDDEWRLLYDFNAMEDDTVTYYISKKYPYYSMGTVPMFENNESLLTLNPHQYVVKQSGTWVDEKGQPLRKFSAFQDFNEANHGFDLIVEKAGSLNHLFGNYISWTGEVIPPRVRCYTDDDVELNFVNEPCDKITSTKNLTQNIFSIHPNPASQVIHFEGVAGDAIIDIYNIHGRNVDSQKVLNNQIDIANLPKGMYILFIITQNKSEKHLVIKVD